MEHLVMARTDPRPNYGSGRRLRDDGYVDLWRPEHPLARVDGYVFEHRLIAWELGLLVDPANEVHHVNGCRSDNRLDNLEIKTSADHAREHAEQRGAVTNQFGTFAVKPREQRASAPKSDKPPCAQCSGVIPASKRSDSRFCSSRCRITAFKKAAR